LTEQWAAKVRYLLLFVATARRCSCHPKSSLCHNVVS